MANLPPLLLIDKPKGISSFSVIRALRRKTGIRKFGHAGTLDPLATGLMLIGVEKGTKLITDLVGLDKEYVADVLIGERRSTGDMEGGIIDERQYQGNITQVQIEEVLSSMVGDIELPVSAYSAIKKDGVPMYKRARAAAAKGETVELVPRRLMSVYTTELLSIEEVLQDNKKRLKLTVRFFVGSGTYIRSLAEEVGARLGYPAVMSDLRRTKVGEYKVEDAQQLEDLGPLYQRVLNKLKFW
jgi:tRNA pseudouridine55 synthase